MTCFINPYIVKGTAADEHVTHFNLIGHKLAFPLKARNYVVDFLEPYLEHITRKPDHHLSLAERNLAHPDGYNFYIDIDVKSPAVLKPETVRELFSFLRQMVVEHVVDDMLKAFFHKASINLKPRALRVSIQEALSLGLSYEKAIVCAFMDNGLDVSKVSPDVRAEIEKVLQGATKLWDNCSMAMKRGTLAKMHIHFPGLVVDAAGARDITQMAVKTQLLKDQFGEALYAGIDAINYMDHQLRMLGSRKGLREQSYYQRVPLDEEHLPKMTSDGPVVQAIVIEDLIHLSLFPIRPATLQFKKNCPGTRPPSSPWSSIKRKSPQNPFEGLTGRVTKRPFKARPKRKESLHYFDSADEDTE